jgi:VCBS repeat-containing protein
VFKITGNGSILGKIVNFGLKVDQIPSGQLNYQDDELDIHLVSDTIDSYSYDAAHNQVTITGRGHVDRDAVLFTVTVSDNGNPGFSDSFTINITGARTSSRSGTSIEWQHPIPQIKGIGKAEKAGGKH